MCIKDSRDKGLGFDIGTGGHGSSFLLQAFDFFFDMEAQYGSAFPLPDVISISDGDRFGDEPLYSEWRTLTNNLLRLGIVHINAAGNQGADQQGGCASPTSATGDPIPYNIAAPANAPPPWLHPDQLDQSPPIPTDSLHVSSANAVGAVGRTDSIHAFSSRGPAAWENIEAEFPCQGPIPPAFRDYPYDYANDSEGLIKPDVVAPSADGMYSTTPGGGYGTFGGTSAAAPHVAGAALLMMQVNPDLTPAEVSMILQTTAVELGAPGKDNDYGAGRIDAYATVQYVLEHFGGTLPQDFVIPAGETWSFEAVTVEFAPGARLIVEGSLNTDGTTFTAADAGQGWGGLRVASGGSAALRDGSVVRDVKSVGGAAVTAFGDFTLDDSDIIGSTLGAGADGIYASGTGTFVHVKNQSVVSGHEGDGIYAYKADVLVENSDILDNGSDGVSTYKGDIALYQSAVERSSNYGANAVYVGSVDFGWPAYSTPSENNTLDDNASGALRATSNSDLAAGTVSGPNGQNNFIRDGSELHAYARTYSDVRAQCNYWGSASGPDTSFVDTDASSTYTYAPFLSAPGGTCGIIQSRKGDTPKGSSQGMSARGGPEAIPELVWEALQAADRGETEVAFGLLVSAVQTATTPEATARAYTAITRLARRGPSPGLAGFLHGQSNRPSERPWALSALTEVHAATGNAETAHEAATALVAEYAGTDHALFGWAALFGLAVEAGDVAGAEAALAAAEAGWPEAEAALAAAEAGWPEAEATAMLRREHTLRLGEGGGAARGAVAGRSGGASGVGAEARGAATTAAEFALYPMYPNPSSGAVMVPLMLPEAAEVSVSVFDVLGRRVAVLAEGRLEAGRREFTLNGRVLPAGVYLVRATMQTDRGAVRALSRRVSVIR